MEIADACTNFVLNRSQVVALFWCLDDFDGYNIPGGDLSIAFVDHGVMTSIHGKFLQDPTPTDVITFDGDSSMDFAGEIIVCPDYGLDRCKEFGTTLDYEILLYLVHGYLHLAGLDDVNGEAVPKMRAAETKCLSHLNSIMDKGWNLIKYA
ncbi:MAG: rRNA maturation RNase YbeY [Puniceicoccales bacterium]|nr:rRNA maturation RNase YbeY [Puniceicoccales bacterium]